ncbi:calcium-binding protein [Streptomyces lanatus]|uniref:Calcium-binding protein n=1 Tax=Streptomyces lanatus TaxID=66900 RepID=A0ABV1Y0J4_9ACTN
MTLALTASIAALSGVAGAAPSSAHAERLNDRSIEYTAASGQANKVTVTATAAEGLASITYVIDDVVPITAGEGCTHPDAADPTKVSCEVATLESQDPYPTLNARLGDGDDTVKYANATDQAYYMASFDLGAGRDTSTQTGGVDGSQVLGGTGDDTITLGSSAVALGGDGNDTMRGADGTINMGGNGADRITAAGDESDADGGAGNDVIDGGAGRQRLNGGAGKDTVRGGTGNDWLYGDPGDDILYGNSGDDTIYGNSGNDKLYGGPGRDTLSGGPGTDVERQD